MNDYQTLSSQQLLDNIIQTLKILHNALTQLIKLLKDSDFQPKAKLQKQNMILNIVTKFKHSINLADINIIKKRQQPLQILISSNSYQCIYSSELNVSSGNNTHSKSKLKEINSQIDLINSNQYKINSIFLQDLTSKDPSQEQIDININELVIETPLIIEIETQNFEQVEQIKLTQFMKDKFINKPQIAIFAFKKSIKKANFNQKILLQIIKNQINEVELFTADSNEFLARNDQSNLLEQNSEANHLTLSDYNIQATLMNGKIQYTGRENQIVDFLQVLEQYKSGKCIIVQDHDSIIVEQV
ncbi:Hypothetical_protein [Hexamita inflata]|uniref:Hypothetical_protein n=1 Tax=Hexamita inflata TaxID=28002 RepID=A0AA86UWH0_9EUKA|nr:Hypothetical protein HINF_LOCUS55051 [Hexamita inflata]